MSAGAHSYAEQVRDAAVEAASRSQVTTIDTAPAGVPVRIHLVGKALAEELAPGVLASPDRADQPVIELWAVDRAGSGCVPPPPPWSTSDYLQGNAVAGWTEQPRLAIFDHEHATLSIADTDAGIGVYWLRDVAGIAPWDGGAPLQSLLRWTLARHGAHLLHAAVVGTDDGGVLLAGAGGSGKSTSALAALSAGMRFVADDYCLVRVGRQPTAHPIFAIAKAHADSLALVGGLDERVHGARLDWRGKARLQIADIVTHELPLRAVVLPRVAERTGPLTRVATTAALREVAVSTVFQLAGDQATTLAALRALTSQLPVFSLEVGPDLPRVIDRLTEAANGSVAVA